VKVEQFKDYYIVSTKNSQIKISGNAIEIIESCQFKEALKISTEIALFQKWPLKDLELNSPEPGLLNQFEIIKAELKNNYLSEENKILTPDFREKEIKKLDDNTKQVEQINQDFINQENEKITVNSNTRGR